MAKEGISPAGRAGFDDDISQEEVEKLLRGFLDSLTEEYKKARGFSHAFAQILRPESEDQ